MNDFTRDKVRGSLIGLAVGDALGMPVEGWSHERIMEKHPGGIRGYVTPEDHKYFDGIAAGTWTDDTYFSLVMARALIEAGKFDMEVIARHHVTGFADYSIGAGGSTREAIRLLNNGVPWNETGKSMSDKLGWGNAVPMKISPLAWLAFGKGQEQWNSNQAVADLSSMSHYTKMSVFAGIMQQSLVKAALWSRPDQEFDFSNHIWFEKHSIRTWTYNKVDGPLSFDVGGMRENGDNIMARYDMVEEVANRPYLYDLDWALKNFGNGSYYLFDSHPFALYFLAKYPDSIEAIYQAASAGGDTDSTASMVGAVVGASRGYKHFELPENKHLLDGLLKKDELLAVADEFVDKLKIDIE
jgi:ADP-ribosyl-[dinitrogen reductase] hydrolase